MQITDVLNRNTIRLRLKVNSKTELFSKMIETGFRTGKIIDKDEVLKEIQKRENLQVTGIGSGIALPHAKTNAVKEALAVLAILDKPLDYDAIDGEPVSIVFLLIDPELSVGNHLRLLSKISKYFGSKGFKDKILNAKDENEILNYFKHLEEL